MISYWIDEAELRESIRRWSRDFGETNAQLLGRVGATTARSLAEFTRPAGITQGAKKKIEGRIEAGAWKTVIEIRKKAAWNRMQKAGEPGIFIRGQWWKLRRNQFEDKVEGVQRHIEKRRRNFGSGGHPRDVPIFARKVVPASTMKKVLAQRRKQAGKAKGGWWGAGLRLQQLIPPVGRAPLSSKGTWVARHRGGGTARVLRVDGDVKHVELINKTRHAKYLISEREMINGGRIAFESLLTWYKAAVKALDSKRHAA